MVNNTSYLLDTNILLWWVDDNKRLKRSIYKVIQDKNNQILVSVVSAIEISIKNNLGKLPLKTSLERIFEGSEFEVLDIGLSHALELNRLPLHSGHRDPFDRVLISQAKAEKLTLITSDEKIWKYKLSILKA
ncbi:MAG: PilT domain-containing protein [Microgenomates group bacterium Gr01-1014_5]|nr:MAG: PilT domain-containing protein [Microgenomates group bacterium Gr01-1014_5]